jgi:N,N'-diacetyllegionaminate synthase
VAQLAILHCVSAYPAPKEEVNLAALRVLEGLGCPVGYSDHTLDAEACVAAVYAGARVLEKHLTLDRAFSDFRDHQLSADPAELRELVRAVRAAERLLGRPDKTLQPSEAQMCAAIRRSAAARGDLPAGHELTAEDLIWLRPAGGVAPGDETQLLGRRLARPLVQGEQVDADAFEAA